MLNLPFFLTSSRVFSSSALYVTLPKEKKLCQHYLFGCPDLTDIPSSFTVCTFKVEKGRTTVDLSSV